MPAWNSKGHYLDEVIYTDPAPLHYPYSLSFCLAKEI